MALINKENNEYVKINEISLIEGYIKVEIHKDKQSKENPNTWLNVVKKTHYLKNEIELEVQKNADNSISKKDNFLNAGYLALKTELYPVSKYEDDL